MVTDRMFHILEDGVAHQALVVNRKRREDRGPAVSWGLRVDLMGD